MNLVCREHPDQLVNARGKGCTECAARTRNSRRRRAARRAAARATEGQQ